MAEGNRLVYSGQKHPSSTQIGSDNAVVWWMGSTFVVTSATGIARGITDCFHDSRWIGLQGIKTKKGVRNGMSSEQEVRSLWKWVFSSAFLASMCCYPSVLLVGLGLMTVSAGDALSNDLYFGSARWILYGLTILLMSIGLYRHFENQGICTIDQAKRERKRIVNTAILMLIVTFAIYFILSLIHI